MEASEIFNQGRQKRKRETSQEQNGIQVERYEIYAFRKICSVMTMNDNEQTTETATASYKKEVRKSMIKDDSLLCVICGRQTSGEHFINCQKLKDTPHPYCDRGLGCMIPIGSECRKKIEASR